MTHSPSSITDHNAALPEGFLHTADQAVVRVDGQELRVVRYRQFDVPLYFVHASLPEGAHEVEVVIKRHYTRAAVHPKRLGIVPDTKKRRTLSFSIRDNPHLVVECDGLGYLFLSFDPVIETPSGTGVLTAADAGVEPGPAVQTEQLQAAIDRVSENDDLDTLLIPAGLFRTGDIQLKSNCRIHLASGAVLKASDAVEDFRKLDTQGSDGTRQCLINAQDAENVSITGHGHIDGNRAVLDLQKYFNGMVKLDRCRGVTFDGIVLSDSCGWNTHFYACNDVLAHRVKILNNRPLVNCINTDGINPNACRNVRIEQCLMHTGDDAVAVKSCTWRRDMHLGHQQMLQDVSDITVSDLLAVNNSTTAKIGTETDAAVMENISFIRIDAVRTGRLCGIDAFDNSLVRNVHFEDCHVHHLDDTMMDRRLIDLNAPAPEDAFRKIIGKSRIDGVTLSNISSEEPARVVLTGRSAEATVANVTLENISVAGEDLTVEDVETNAFVENLDVR
jgi:hypothetical protein